MKYLVCILFACFITANIVKADDETIKQNWAKWQNEQAQKDKEHQELIKDQKW